MRVFVDTNFELYKDYTLVLGDMGELGENEIKYHTDLGSYINNKPNLNRNAKIISIGTLSKNITDAITKCETHHFNSIEEGVDFLKNNIQPPVTLFLKASRSMKFENIISGLNG